MRFAAILVALLIHGPVLAGGGPENVALVINAKSQSSLAIANHYAHLRQIPAINLVRIDWDGPLDLIKVEAFREKILQPAITTLAQRGVLGQIDYLIYSSDFPYSIDFSGLGAIKGVPEGAAMVFQPTGSITGLTYLWQSVLAGSPDPVLLRTNQYMRTADGQLRDDKPRGFRSWHGWGPDGRLSATGRHYMLSMMLGLTTKNGNSIPEVLSYLSRSAAADGTRPKGTIYFAQNSNIRSQRRHGHYPQVVRELEALGVRAEIVTAEAPNGKKDVQGAMLGISTFDWKATGSTILPGAFCDHFTSFGGAIERGSGQTLLTEFLRHGAAGACGTVIEPTAQVEKFPHPRVHVYYAHGCTLAEALYQSVFGPYQLLSVGDPLCRPWAEIPQVRALGLVRHGEVAGVLKLRPDATFKRTGVTAGYWELFVDGVRAARAKGETELKFDTKTLSDGYHELRLVVVDDTPIETQGRTIVPVMVNNFGRHITLSPPATKSVRHGQPLVVTVKANDAQQVVVIAQQHVVGKLEGGEGRIKIDTRQLGPGPISLRAVAFGAKENDRAPELAVSRPAEINVLPEATR
jgi:hypothetical protein